MHASWLAAAALALAACGSDSTGGDDDGPTNVPGTVAIQGDAMVGATLTAEVSDGNGVSGSVAYRWDADGAEISGAVDASYTLTADEVGAAITVTATYTDDDGFAESPTSAPTDAVGGAANEPGSIAISGVPTIGRTLDAVITDANGTASSSPAYQWVADGTDIAGATAASYELTSSELGAMITVRADYVDDDGYAESVTSDALGPISETPINVEGTVSIVGLNLVGETLTAQVDDPNGTSAAITYQWKADDTDIAGATTGTYVPTLAERAALLSVTVSYTDDDGFAEGPTTGTADDIVYTAIATGETTLAAAAAAAVEGDVIGLDSAAGGDDYTDMAEIDFAANAMLITRTVASTAVIRGTTCLVFSGEGTVVDGLVFDGLDWIGGGTCDANGDASVFVRGTGVTLRNSEFRGEASPRAVPADDPYHYLALKGVDNVVERNLFQGKDTDLEGSAITMFANTTPMSNQGHTVQYNLFKNFLGKSGDAAQRASSAYAIQVGRTTGADSQGEGLFTIQFNRFDTVQSEQRLMRVQSSANVIRDNTVVNSLGLIALEDGFGNTVARNVILSSGDDNDDGGISFAPLGHTVTDNYINNLRTTSSQRGGLFINPKPMTGTGNGAILATPGLDFTVTVARNTVVNARRAIIFDDANCAVLAPILDFDDNLVMNQSSGESINGNTNGVGRDAVTDGDFITAGCALAAASDFDGNHFYSATLSQSVMFDFNGALADNVVGDEDGAAFTRDANGLVNGSGGAAGIGVDTSTLTVLEETQVGPGSTWAAP